MIFPCPVEAVFWLTNARMPANVGAPNDVPPKTVRFVSVLEFRKPF